MLARDGRARRELPCRRGVDLRVARTGRSAVAQVARDARAASTRGRRTRGVGGRAGLLVGVGWASGASAGLRAPMARARRSSVAVACACVRGGDDLQAERAAGAARAARRWRRWRARGTARARVRCSRGWRGASTSRGAGLAARREVSRPSGALQTACPSRECTSAERTTFGQIRARAARPSPTKSWSGRAGAEVGGPRSQPSRRAARLGLRPVGRPRQRPLRRGRPAEHPSKSPTKRSATLP